MWIFLLHLCLYGKHKLAMNFGYFPMICEAKMIAFVFQ